MNGREITDQLPAARPSVQMAFACESVGGESGGPVSFQNVMDGIGAADFPAVTGEWFAIFSFFSPVALTVANCRIVVADDKGEIIAQTGLKNLTFSAEGRLSRNVVRFQGLAWPYPGNYLIKFIANGDDVLAAFPMLVQHAPAPAGEPLSE
ncbi:MAG: hypothetical protein ACREM8_00350 [Vulcanimicrobiaceae bacterium]